MIPEFEKWIRFINYDIFSDTIPFGIHNDGNYTIWFTIPKRIAELLISKYNLDVRDDWLEGNDLFLQMEYHADGYPTSFGIDYDTGVEDIDDMPDDIRTIIDGYYKKWLEEA